MCVCPPSKRCHALLPAQASGKADHTSFGALDALLALLDDRARFPALQLITVAGFGAGAQTAQLYAWATSRGARGEPAANQTVVRFWTASANSYLYLSGARPLGACRAMQVQRLCLWKPGRGWKQCWWSTHVWLGHVWLGAGVASGKAGQVGLTCRGPVRPELPRWVVPSSHVFPHASLPTQDTGTSHTCDRFATPTLGARRACPAYNAWGLGTALGLSASPYLWPLRGDAAAVDTRTQTFLRKQVVYVDGARDYCNCQVRLRLSVLAGAQSHLWRWEGGRHRLAAHCGRWA